MILFALPGAGAVGGAAIAVALCLLCMLPVLLERVEGALGLILPAAGVGAAGGSVNGLIWLLINLDVFDTAGTPPGTS